MPSTPDSDSVTARPGASAPLSPAIEELSPELLRARWLTPDAPAPIVTYVAAPPPPTRRRRSLAALLPGNAPAPSSTPHRPAAPAPRRPVARAIALLRACVRRGGGRRLLLLSAPAMLMLALAGGFALGSRYAAGAQPATAIAAAAPASIVNPTPTAPADEAPAAPTATAVAAIAPAAATAAPVRVAVRLSCNDESGTLGLRLDLATTEVIAVGLNRCAGWHLVQADTVVSWVPSESLVSATQDAATATGAAR